MHMVQGLFQGLPNVHMDSPTLQCHPASCWHGVMLLHPVAQWRHEQRLHGCHVHGSNFRPRHSPGMKVPHRQQHRDDVHVPRLQVLRIFGFTTAGAPEITCCRSKRRPIQPAPFKYNEEALRYYDFFMSECARVTLRA